MPRKGSGAKKCPRCGFFLSQAGVDTVREEWKNAFKPWSKDEMMALVEKIDSGQYVESDVLTLAAEFERPPTAISKRMMILGLRFPEKKKQEGLEGLDEEELRRMEREGEI